MLVLNIPRHTNNSYGKMRLTDLSVRRVLLRL